VLFSHEKLKPFGQDEMGSGLSAVVDYLGPQAEPRESVRPLVVGLGQEGGIEGA